MMPEVANDRVDHETICWTASARSAGAEAALWAIAAGLCRLAAATDRGARNFGPEADISAPTRAVESLAVAVDSIAEALSGRADRNH
jgi:hypothetical protein